MTSCMGSSDGPPDSEVHIAYAAFCGSAPPFWSEFKGEPALFGMPMGAKKKNNHSRGGQCFSPRSTTLAAVPALFSENNRKVKKADSMLHVQYPKSPTSSRSAWQVKSFRVDGILGSSEMGLPFSGGIGRDSVSPLGPRWGGVHLSRAMAKTLHSERKLTLRMLFGPQN